MKKSDVPIGTPCHADWRSMTPADKGRFCGDCKKVVHDLSKMRERDARALLATPPNSGLCVRYLYDEHGKIFFGGEQSTLMPATFLQRAKRAALSAAAIALPLSIQACSLSPLGYGETMGDVTGPSIDPPILPDDGGSDGGPDGAPKPHDGGRDAAPRPDAGDAGDAGADAADAETPL